MILFTRTPARLRGKLLGLRGGHVHFPVAGDNGLAVSAIHNCVFSFISVWLYLSCPLRSGAGRNQWSNLLGYSENAGICQVFSEKIRFFDRKPANTVAIRGTCAQGEMRRSGGENTGLYLSSRYAALGSFLPSINSREAPLDTAEAPPAAGEARLYRGSGTICSSDRAANRNAATGDRRR